MYPNIDDTGFPELAELHASQSPISSPTSTVPPSSAAISALSLLNLSITHLRDLLLITMSSPNNQSTVLDGSPSLNFKEQKVTSWFGPGTALSWINHCNTTPFVPEHGKDWYYGSPTLFEWSKKNWFPETDEEREERQSHYRDSEQIGMLTSSNSSTNLARKTTKTCTRTFSKIPVVSPVIEESAHDLIYTSPSPIQSPISRPVLRRRNGTPTIPLTWGGLGVYIPDNSIDSTRIGLGIMGLPDVVQGTIERQHDYYDYYDYYDHYDHYDHYDYMDFTNNEDIDNEEFEAIIDALKTPGLWGTIYDWIKEALGMSD